jgi:hypothetical protein
MKTKIVSLFFVSLLLLSGLFLSSGCVGAMYGRSGVFVTNNYADMSIVVATNNGMAGRVETGQTLQVITASLLNGDRMLVTAKFYDKTGNYIGYDEQEFRVYYRNGSPFVKHWDPKLQEKKLLKEKVVKKK